MKLQSKRTVNADIQKERKSQIDEGITLARKIDTMRETHGDEQSQLEQFRKNAVAEAQEMERAHAIRKEAMESELKVLLEARAKAIEPLNHEWEKVESVIATLKESTDKLIEEKNTVDAQSTANNKKGQDLKVRERRIAENERSYRTRADALITREAVLQKGEADLEHRKESVEANISENYQKLDKRAAEIGEKLVNVEFREAYLTEWEQRLINKETKLTSDQQALIAAKEYIDQHGKHN